MTMTRKEFVGSLLTGAAALALVGACSDSGSSADAGGGPDAAPPNCTGNGAKSTGSQIAGNHGHSLTIPAADVNGTSMDRTYSIKGSSAHDHMVTITSADFDKLKANVSGFVMRTSTSEGTHMHVVTVFCA